MVNTMAALIMFTPFRASCFYLGLNLSQEKDWLISEQLKIPQRRFAIDNSKDSVLKCLRRVLYSCSFCRQLQCVSKQPGGHISKRYGVLSPYCPNRIYTSNRRLSALSELAQILVQSSSLCDNLATERANRAHGFERGRPNRLSVPVSTPLCGRNIRKTQISKKRECISEGMAILYRRKKSLFMKKKFMMIAQDTTFVSMPTRGRPQLYTIGI